VLGPNGAGKSTLLATLAGARPAQGGVVRAGATPLSQLDVEELAQRRALVTDRWHDPFAASVLETVLTARYRFGPGDADGAAGRAAAQRALALLDVQHLAARDVRRLSRGERQRVAIATALAQETPLLLLDEPIAHQDPRHQQSVLDVLAQLRERTLLISLHDINAAARFATHALLLAGDGRWQAGAAPEVLTAEHLSALFATELTTLSDGARSVWIPAAAAQKGLQYAPPPL
jgi:iron complex transport system ATP-binding protein